MAYLHENREEFTNAANLASEYFHVMPNAESGKKAFASYL